MKPGSIRNYLALAAAGVFILAAGLIARADYSSAVLADGPLTYHRFSETGVTNDTVPVVANIGTLGAAANGTHFTSFRDDMIVQGLPGALGDPNNTAMSVPYSPITHTNFVKVPWQAGLAYNGPFSFEIWTKPSTRYYNYPFGMVNWFSPRTGWVFLQSDWDNLVTGNGWVFRVYRNSGTTSSTAYYTFAMNTNHWYHVVGVYDGAYVRLYVDGTEVNNAACTAYVPAATNSLHFGVTGNSQYQHGGLFDEAAFYTNALSADEVAAHYACATTNPTYYPTMVLAKNPPGYWRFNEQFSPSVAINSGSRGTAANGQYRLYSTTVPELQSPAFPGFETDNRVLQVFGTNGQMVAPPLNVNTDTLTVECMLKRSGMQSNLAGIVMHRRVEVNSGSTFAAGLNFGNAANQLGYVWNSTNTGASDSFSFVSSLTPPEDTWVYAALVITPTTGTIYVYDGTNWSSEANSKPHKPASFIGPWRVGSDGNIANRFLRGLVDEVAIYDKALTESQLRSHALAAFGDTNTPAFLTGTPVVDPGTIYAGMPFTLTIDGYGTPPLSYQWRLGDSAKQTSILDATNAVYSKASASDADTGYYDVIISNASGSVTSSMANVNISSQYGASITQDPVSRAVYPGGNVTLSVAADGPALTYQWQHADTNLPGATSATLTVASVDATKTGEYRVGVTNAAGGTLSGAATLSLIAFDPNNTYVSAVLADAPEAYWRLDETAAPTVYDWMGRHDGETWRSTPAFDPTGSQWGSAWSQTGALADDPDMALAFNGNNFASIPYSPDLNAPTYTIELWAKPTTLAASTTFYPLVSEDFFTSGAQVTPPCLPDNYRGGYRFALAGSSTSAGVWTFGVGGMTTWDVQLITAPQAVNTWVHLVGTFDGWQESLYTNGVLVTSTIGLGLPNQRLALYIGGDNAAWGFGNPFKGVVDEAAYYKTVLTPSRIKLHYQLGKYGTNNLPVFITPPASQTVEFGTTASFNPALVGATPRTYVWKRNATPVAGGTDLALSFTSVDYTDAGQYTLAVTNSFGGTVSSAATLAVTPPASVTNLTSRISYTPTGPKLELIWPLGYTLYSTTNLITETWLPVSGATAPYYNVPINTTIEKMFFKIK